MLLIENKDNEFTFTRGNDYPVKIDSSFTSSPNIAAVYLTSGTTDVSKVVPLTHANLMTAAQTHKEVYAVKHTDHTINVIPLFHIYGMTGSVLVAAAGGAAVYCMAKVNIAEFFTVLKNLRINWYAAEPAVQSAIAEYAKRMHTNADDYILSVIRSGGAALPMNTLKTLEEHFHAVVLPGYGMTETGGLGSTNSIEPYALRSNSSGLITGISLKIIDEENKEVATGEIGQIIAKGPSVAAGYENKKDDSAFMPNGWFATGDLAYLDDDGYLYIAGRMGDVINKGGDKVSPYEVERVLLTHPGIMEAVVYPTPHPTLGELPMAAVVLADDVDDVTEDSLKRFLQKKLADVKIPARIFFTRQIPKNDAGKIVRSSIYQYMQKHPAKFWEIKENKGTDQAEDDKLRQIEKDLTTIWQDILKIDNIGIDDNYFAIGGDSISIAYLFTQIEKKFAVQLPTESILTKGTIRDLALMIHQKVKTTENLDFVVPQHIANNNKPPIFCLHALNGDAFTYRKLTEHMGKDYTLYSVVFKLRSPKIHHPAQLTQLAAVYIEEIRKVQSHGPYCLLGYSLGGALAFEVARQLKEQGQEIGLLALLDTRFDFTDALIRRTFNILRAKMLQEIKVFHNVSNNLEYEFVIARALQYVFKNYELSPYDGKLLYFRAKLADARYEEESLEKLRHYSQGVKIIDIEAKHAELIFEPAVGKIAEYLEKIVDNLVL